MTTTATDRQARAKRAQAEGRKRAGTVTPKSPAPQPQAKPAAKQTPKPAPAKPRAEVVKATRREPAKRSTAAPAAPTHDPNGFSLEQAVTNMELTHVQCRDFGHSWRPYSARWLSAYNSYESQLLCQRCKTVRTRFLSRTGAQLNSQYDYADGYLVKGMGRLTGGDRDVIRLASILAVLAPDTADE